MVSNSATATRTANALDCKHCDRAVRDLTEDGYCQDCEKSFQAMLERVSIEADLKFEERHQEWLCELRRTNRICRNCHEAERNDRHPLCTTCYEQAYLPTLQDCAEGCNRKAGRGYDTCLDCARHYEAMAAYVKLEAEVARLDELQLTGKNGCRHTRDFIRQHLEEVREQAAELALRSSSQKGRRRVRTYQ